jgi:hypothetical protein
MAAAARWWLRSGPSPSMAGGVGHRHGDALRWRSWGGGALGPRLLPLLHVEAPGAGDDGQIWLACAVEAAMVVGARWWRRGDHARWQCGGRLRGVRRRRSGWWSDGRGKRVSERRRPPSRSCGLGSFVPIISESLVLA